MNLGRREFVRRCIADCTYAQGVELAGVLAALRDSPKENLGGMRTSTNQPVIPEKVFDCFVERDEILWVHDFDGWTFDNTRTTAFEFSSELVRARVASRQQNRA